jgi:hypothetical protein
MLIGLTESFVVGERDQNTGIRIAAKNKKDNYLANPTVKMLVDNLGMPAQVAQMVVGYAAIVLRTIIHQNQEPERDVKQLGIALENLLKTDYPYRSGIALRLSRATGLTVDEAALGLEKAVMSLNKNFIQN